MVNKKNYFELSHPQKRVWLTEKVTDNANVNTIGGILKIRDKIDIPIMKQVINEVIKENSALRLRITTVQKETCQYIEDYTEEDIDVFDLRLDPQGNEKFKSLADAIFNKKNITEENKLYYFSVFMVNESLSGVLLCLNHIVADGWAFSLIENKICEKYGAYVNGSKTIEVKAEYSYIDYVAEEKKYISSENFVRDREYWLRRMNNIPEEFLYNSSDSVIGKRLSMTIPKNVSEELKGFLQLHRSSMNSFFILLTLLYRYKITGQKDNVLGVPIYNRINRKQKNLVGMLTSTMPLRVQINEKASIIELLSNIKSLVYDDMKHQRHPYDLLIKDLELGKSGYDSLFKICVNYYNTSMKSKINETECDIEEWYSGTQSYSLQIVINEWEDESLVLHYDYKTEEYRELEMKSMYQSFINMITQILSGKKTIVEDITLLSELEIHQKVFTRNNTAFPYREVPVPHLFEEQAKKNPEKIALTWKDTSVTYGELNVQANQMGHFLNQRGVTNHTIVGLLLNHSIQLVISIFGVLKAGAAYLPIDPESPTERIRYVLDNSECKVLLIDQEHILDMEKKETIRYQDIPLESYNEGNLEQVRCDGEDLAYIIYTSGTTGYPKGVMIPHKGLTNYVSWATKHYFKKDEVIMPLYSSIGFDLTVTSIFAPLISGNQIRIYDNNIEHTFFQMLEENKVNVLKLTPSHLYLLLKYDNRNSKLKRLIVGGENLKKSLADAVYKSFSGQIEIYNEYGPTEAVVGCIVHKYQPEASTGMSVPIGQPISNTSVYLLGQGLQVVPDGCYGELFISGQGLAKGYLKQDTLTKEKFIDNPFLNGEKMYRTGDLANYTENGVIEFIGRMDNQVKVRGHRIELNEIETQLVRIKVIEEAVVTVVHYMGNDILTAYIVSENTVEYEDIRNSLQNYLPEYMIPNIFVPIQKVPLTSNGKVDMNALPQPITEQKEYASSETELEKLFVKAMEDILETDKINMNLNFYELGGDSIKAIQLVAALHKYGYSIKVNDLLTVDSIRTALRKAKPEKRRDKERDCSAAFQKTPILEWFFSGDITDYNAYHQYIVIDPKETYELADLELGIQLLIQQHESLIMNYSFKDGTLFYNQKHLNDKMTVRVIQSPSADFTQKGFSFKEILESLVSKNKLDQDVLFALYVVVDGKGNSRLAFTAHHILTDGVSWRILVEDFLFLMECIKNKKPVLFPFHTNTFKSWSDCLYEYSKREWKDEFIYWQGVIEKIKKSNAANIGLSDTFNSKPLSFAIESDLMTELQQLSSSEFNMRLNEILTIVLVLTIQKLSGRSEVVIEMEKHGREAIDETIDLSRTVGWFTCMYPVYFELGSEDSGENIVVLKEQLRRAEKYGLSYGILKYMKKMLPTEVGSKIRFNYLGEFTFLSSKKEKGAVIEDYGLLSGTNITGASLDITATFRGNRIEFDLVPMDELGFDLVRFEDIYLSELKKTIEIGKGKAGHLLSPSDFIHAELSQEDINTLFI